MNLFTLPIINDQNAAETEKLKETCRYKCGLIKYFIIKKKSNEKLNLSCPVRNNLGPSNFDFKNINYPTVIRKS